MQWEARLWKGPYWQDGLTLVGGKVVVVCAGNVGGRHVTAWWLHWLIGGFIGEDRFHSSGDVVQCEPGWINLCIRVCAQLLDHVMGEGMEEDGSLFVCYDGQLPELLHGDKEVEGKPKFGQIYCWGHGDVKTEISVEVGSKTVTSLHTVGDTLGRNDCISSEAKILDEGEEHHNLLGDGLVQVKVADGNPELCCDIPLLALDNRPP